MTYNNSWDHHPEILTRFYFALCHLVFYIILYWGNYYDPRFYAKINPSRKKSIYSSKTQTKYPFNLSKYKQSSRIISISNSLSFDSLQEISATSAWTAMAASSTPIPWNLICSSPVRPAPDQHLPNMMPRFHQTESSDHSWTRTRHIKWQTADERRAAIVSSAVVILYNMHRHSTGRTSLFGIAVSINSCQHQTKI